MPLQTSVAILKFDNVPDVKHVTLKTNFGRQQLLNLVIGGKDAFYFGLNGQFANIAFKLGPGAYFTHYDFAKKYLDNRVPHPLPDENKLKAIDLLNDEKTFKFDSKEAIVKDLSKEALF